MSIVGWCWAAWLLFLTIVGIRCVKKVIAMPGEWTAITSKIANTMEGDHGADHGNQMMPVTVPRTSSLDRHLRPQMWDRSRAPDSRRRSRPK